VTTVPGPGGGAEVDGPDPAAIAASAARVRARVVAAGGEVDRIRVVAVTKGFGVEVVRAALAAGLVDLGENYGIELADKAAAVTGPRWHHIGAIQRRQVRRLAPIVTLWHGLCRVEEARAIAAVRPEADVLVQVETLGRTDRRGVPVDQVASVVRQVRGAGVRPVGLMVIGAAGDPRATEQAFRRTAALADDLGLPERSMGMSDDLEAAVAAGATIVRVGRALFGPRVPKFHRSDGSAK
jgi:uncharacterized pyridoxal phosphate-containing UPF0001 family protein